MSRNIVVLLKSNEGRALVEEKCQAAGMRIETLEELIKAELDQQGKMRKRGLRYEFDHIFDDALSEDDN